MKIGFTGTSRNEPSAAQLIRLEVVLARLWEPGSEFHHGDAIYSDERAHAIASAIGYWTVGHPPIDPRKRAFCQCNELREPKPYLVRDRDIIDDTGYLVATPRTVIREIRSGTWYTVRYAEKLGRPITLILPDGTVIAPDGTTPA